MSRFRSLITIVATLGLVLGSAVAAQAAPPPKPVCDVTASAGVQDVAVQATKVVITGNVAPGCKGKVTIRSAPPVGALAPDAGHVITTVTPKKDGTFAAKVSRFPHGTDLSYARVFATTGGAVVGGARYATDFDVAPVNTAERFTASSIKGVSVTMSSDAAEIGAEHSAISLALNQLMVAGPEEGAIEFESQGKTYYFDGAFTQSLDSRIKALSDQDITVYLVLVLIYGDVAKDPNSSFPMLVHPDAPKGDTGYFMTYAFNTVTEEGIAAYTAAMEFIASRYSRDDERYGKALDYIIGNEINSAAAWQAMGEKELPDFVNNYAPALRLGWLAAQRYSAQTRVYTSLDHYWTGRADPNRPLLFYPGKDTLDLLTTTLAAEGDFGWNVAQHPYPSNMFSPLVWDDPVVDDVTTDKVTFKNIHVLSDYMKRPEMLFNGAPRSIILSEQACQSPSNSVEDQTLQAACMAYAYYKVSAAGGIDAFLWDPQVDNKAAVGLRMGLWTWDDAREDQPAAPGEKKLSYDLWRDIDTAASLDKSAFALDVIGIESWNDVIPNFDESMIRHRHDMRQVGLETSATSTPPATAGFESGTNGWQTADATSSVAALAMTDAAEGAAVLSVNFDDTEVIRDNSANNKMWRGASTRFAEPVDATATPYLRAELRLDPGVADAFDPDNRLSAQVRVMATDGSVAFGTARLATDGWNTLHLDLSGWDQRSSIERATIWVQGSTGQDWHGTFQLDNIAFVPSITLGDEAAIDVRAVAADRDGIDTPVTVTVMNQGSAPLSGAVTFDNCAGTAFADMALDVDALAGGGGTATLATTITAFDSANPNWPVICAEYGGQTYRVNIELPAPGPKLLYDFESGTQGWVAGDNIASVSRVSTFPNGPFGPHGGTGALQGIMDNVDNASPRTLSVRPEVPLMLAGADELYAWVDSYGAAPGATGYEVTMTVYSGDESISVVKDDFRPDSWNKVTIDLRDWAPRNNVTGIDISLRVLGADGTVWPADPKMQVDDVGVNGANYQAGSAWFAAWSGNIGGHFTGESEPNVTYRQLMNVNTSGDAVRVRFSNVLGATPLRFDAASVALRGGDGAGTSDAPVAVTVAGAQSFEVPPGETVYSDPVALSVAPGDDLAVSTYSTEALPMLTHDWGLKTHYVSTAGDHTADAGADAYMAGGGMQSIWVDAIDVFSNVPRGTVAVLGDSIADGAGADLDGDNRLSDALGEKLGAQTVKSGLNRTVINAAIGGNTLSAVGNAQVGENGLLRLDRDVLSQSGLDSVLVFEGTNDIYVGSTAAQTIYVLERTAQRLHDAGVHAVVSTIIPRGNGVGWTDVMEQKRQEVNAWIRSQSVFDAVVDLDPVLADPADPTVLSAEFDADGTHPNAAGLAALAAAIDPAVFGGERGNQTQNLHIVSDFEADAGGWVAGPGTDSVSRASSFPNGPGWPMVGAGVLDLALSAGSAGEPKAASVTFDTPVDMSGASEAYAWVNGYGGLPDATGYAVDITVHAGADSRTGTTTEFRSDQWNRVAVDIAGWAGASAVTGIDITYRILGSTMDWSGAHFQIDEVGFIVPVLPPPVSTELFTFETDTQGWQAGDLVTSVDTVTSFPNGPGFPHGGVRAFQATMEGGDVSQPRSVFVEPEQPFDFTGASALTLWFDAYGGIPDATGYAVDVTLTSGDSTITGTLEGYQPDSWQQVTVDVAGWTGLAAVDRIEVTYRILGSHWDWDPGAKFQLDDIAVVTPG